MTAKIRVACVGAGYFSQFHLGSWSRIGAVDLLAACDRDLAKARATGLAPYDDLATMLAELAPDLLDLIVPPAAQATAIRTALNMGVKWIICQKPFCTSLDEARRITDAAEKAGAVLVIHENFRFQPWYRRLKTLIDGGSLGTVQQMTFRLRPGDGQGPDAYLDRQPYFRDMAQFLVHETAVHWIDTFRFLLGDPTAVYADLRRLNPVIAGEDAGIILFDHPNGVRAIFDGNRHLDHDAGNLRRTMGEALVEGTGGSLALLGDGSLRLRRFGTRTSKEVLAPDRWDGFGGDCVHALQNHVVSALMRGAEPENTAREYLKVIEVENAVYRSAETGRKISLADV